MAAITRFTRTKSGKSYRKPKHTSSYSVYYDHSTVRKNTLEDRISRNTVNLDTDIVLPSPVTEVRLKIDKVVLALNVPIELRDFVLNNIEKVVEELKGKGESPFTKNKSRYRRTYLFRIHNRNVNGKRKRLQISVSYNPYDKKDAFILVDFNVSKLRKTGRKNLLVLISSMVGNANVDEILAKAHFTHIELAMDFHGLNIRDLLFYKLSAQRSSIQFRPSEEVYLETDSDGEIIAIRLNSRNSDTIVKCYNKTADINRKRWKKGKNNGLKKSEVTFMKDDRTRIEVVFRRGKYPLSTIADIKYPAYQILIFNKEVFSEFPNAWEFDAWRSLFMHACARLGLYGAIRALPPNRCRSIRRKLREMNSYIELEPIFLTLWPQALRKLDFLRK